jgi:hypothetical protein
MTAPLVVARWSAAAEWPTQAPAGLRDAHPEYSIAHRGRTEKESQPAVMGQGQYQRSESACEPHDREKDSDDTVGGSELGLPPLRFMACGHGSL